MYIFPSFVHTNSIEAPVLYFCFSPPPWVYPYGDREGRYIAMDANKNKNAQGAASKTQNSANTEFADEMNANTKSNKTTNSTTSTTTSNTTTNCR